MRFLPLALPLICPWCRTFTQVRKVNTKCLTVGPGVAYFTQVRGEAVAVPLTLIASHLALV